MKIKKQIIEKLVGLGLIENGDQIRVLKKDELQPMTEEMENKARKTHHQSKLTVYENIVTEDISVILRRIKSTPSVRKTLQARVSSVLTQLDILEQKYYLESVYF